MLIRLTDFRIKLKLKKKWKSESKPQILTRIRRERMEGGCLEPEAGEKNRNKTNTSTATKLDRLQTIPTRLETSISRVFLLRANELYSFRTQPFIRTWGLERLSSPSISDLKTVRFGRGFGKNGDGIGCRKGWWLHDQFLVVIGAISPATMADSLKGGVVWWGRWETRLF